MNILVLSYIQTNAEAWKLSTARFLNSWINHKDIHITLVFVRSEYCQEINIFEELHMDIEFHVVTFAQNRDTGDTPLCVDEFLYVSNQTLLTKKLEEILVEKEYDIIQVESILFAPYLDTLSLMSKAKIIFKPLFIESGEIERISQIPKFSLIKRYHQGRSVAKVKDYERIMPRKFDYLIANDNSIYEYFYANGLKKCYFVPFDWQCETQYEERINKVSGNLKLFYAGCLHNKEVMRAILWFLNEIWTSLLKIDHTLELHIAGPAPEWFVDLIESRLGVVYHETIGNIDDFVGSKNVMIMPFEQPLGVSKVIIRALQMGKMIVANPLAVRDFNFTPMFHFMPARTAGAFERLIERIIKQPQLLEESSREIIKFAKENLTEEFLPKILLNFYRQINKQKTETKL